ncbi:MAG TPA: signal peptidase I, partial [Clostridiales bacterium]|nr:signal peptidase I [Clostridiales bacterium]
MKRDLIHASPFLYSRKSGYMNQTQLPDEKQEKREHYIGRELFDWVETFVFALVAVVIVFTFIFRLVTVDGRSMNPTLQDGDRLVITDLFYTPHTGDIVVVQRDGADTTPLIKRVIATGGQKLDIDFDTWTVTVIDFDGTEHVLKEEYVNFMEGYSMAVGTTFSAGDYPITIPAGYIFVMGDNRN